MIVDVPSVALAALAEVEAALDAWHFGELSGRAALVVIEQTLAEQKGRE